MNKTTLKLVLALLISTTAFVAKAQVTIGTEAVPNKGALLDLKERVPSGDNTTANNGLLFPRVNLTDKNNLFPMFENNGSGGYKKGAAQYVKADEDKSHTGLVVYNLSDAGDFVPGLYVWDGTEWTTCKCGDDGPIVDPGNVTIQTVFKGGIVGMYSETPEYRFNPEKLTLTTPDGLYTVRIRCGTTMADGYLEIIPSSAINNASDGNISWNGVFSDDHQIYAEGSTSTPIWGSASQRVDRIAHSSDPDAQRTYIWSSTNEKIKVMYKLWVDILSKYPRLVDGSAKVVLKIEQYTWTY